MSPASVGLKLSHPAFHQRFFDVCSFRVSKDFESADTDISHTFMVFFAFRPDVPE